jgi:hypothetical protein
MKKIYFVLFALLMAATLVWMAGCGREGATSPVASSNPTLSVRNEATAVTGTSLSIDSIYMHCYNENLWRIIKTMDTTPAVICKTQCMDLDVTVNATKILVPAIEGKIFLRNTGTEATENLNITVTLLRSCNGGAFEVVTENWPARELSAKPILNGGELFGYYFEVSMVNFGGIDPNCQYKVIANVSITNYVDHLGETFIVTKESEAIYGCPPANDCVTLTDVPGKITPANPEASTTAWNITVFPTSLEVCETGTYHFTLHVCNMGVPTEETFVAENSITVNPPAINPSSNLKAKYNLSTIGCTPPSGCTRTIGFYKTHAVTNLYGHNRDMVTPYLPIYLGTIGGPKTVVVSLNTQVVSIMQRVGGSSNGIVKLYAQLLGAKLNIAGANGSGTGTSNICIATAIAAADAFLATHNDAGWNSLSKTDQKAVLGWMSTFDKYNNGLLACAPHCDTPVGPTNN